MLSQYIRKKYLHKRPLSSIYHGNVKDKLLVEAATTLRVEFAITTHLKEAHKR